VLKLTLRMLATLLALLARPGGGCPDHPNHLRGPVIRYVETHSGGSTSQGKFHTYLFRYIPGSLPSGSPSAILLDVIGNHSRNRTSVADV